MALGEKLSKLRKENNYTQEQLADVLGISRQAISKWESDITYPETDKLIRICKLFNCSIDYLLIEDEICSNQKNKNTSICKLLPENQLLMSEVSKYIDMLFLYQRKNAKTEELKEKLLNEMIKNINELMMQGLDEIDALKMAKESIMNEDWLTDENQITDIQEYLVQCSYSVLLHCTLFWIFSLPLLFAKYAPICYIGLVLTLLAAIFYVFESKRIKNTNILALVSISESKKRKKTVWRLWGIFFSIFVVAKAVALFGSNLWFGRPIEITGLYSVINIVLHFYVPLLSIFIPMAVGSFTNLLLKNERSHENEQKK